MSEGKTAKNANLASFAPEQRTEILRRCANREQFADIARELQVPKLTVSRLCFAALYRGEITLD